MSPRDPAADRLAALTAMSPSQLSRTLAAVPHVMERMSAPLSLRKVATAMVEFSTLTTTLQMLSPHALVLVSLASSFDGALTEDDFVREAPMLTVAHRTAIVAELTDRVLIDPTLGYVVLRPGVADRVHVAGARLQDALERGLLRNEDLVGMLRRHTDHHLPSSTAARIRELMRLIADGESVQRIASTLSPSGQVMLEQLAQAGGIGCSLAALGVETHPLRLAALYPNRFPGGESIQAVLELQGFGFVFVDLERARISIWREVLTALECRIVVSWPPAWTGQPVSIPSRTVRTPVSPSNLASLLRRMDNEPLAGLKAGGVGVKTFRDLAKRLGQTERTVTTMFALGESLGLIEELSQLVGRGRTAGWQFQYALVRSASEVFQTMHVADQWYQLVRIWMDESRGDAAGGPPKAFIRQFLADLLELDNDSAIAEADLQAWITSQHHVGRSIDTDELAGSLRALDVIEPVGPIALTPLSRVLLTEPERVRELLPDLESTFVVQADHTVVTPPTLDPAIRSRLESLATVTSDSSVRVYRLDPVKIAGALAGDETSASLIEWLTQHSVAELPASIRQLVLDTERQRGDLAVTAAATVVTAADVLGLAAALKIKAARLTMIAPTVAISDLSPAKVTAALRAKGLAPNIAGATVALPSSAAVHRYAARPPTPAKSPRPLILGPKALGAMARSAT